MKKRIFFYFLFIFAFSLYFYSEGEAKRSIKRAKKRKYREEKITLQVTGNIQKDINRLIERSVFRKARFGVLIVSLDNGKAIYTRNAERNFVPASNTKLFTTATALVKLGPEFTHKTTLYSEGEIDSSGLLFGDLIISGSGDPTISKEFWENPVEILESWADSLRKRGVRIVAGDVRGEGRGFSSEISRIGLAGKDFMEKRMGGLVFNENRIKISAVPGEFLGDSARIYVDLPNAYVISNQMKTLPMKYVNKRGRIRTKRVRVIQGEEMNVEFAGDTLKITGGIGAGQDGLSKIAYSPSPAKHFASIFKGVLERKGIKVLGGFKESDEINISSASSVKIAEYSSPPLLEFIKIVNKESHNFFAECLLRTLGFENMGEGSASAGCSVIEKFLDSIGIKDVYFEDGSGLSRGNSASPLSVIELLKFMYKHPYWKDFYNSLAVAGIDGTLKGRMVSLSGALGNVRAKTGTVRGVSALSGYVEAMNGKTFAFCILVNDTRKIRTAQKVEDFICEILARYLGEKG